MYIHGSQPYQINSSKNVSIFCVCVYMELKNDDVCVYNTCACVCVCLQEEQQPGVHPVWPRLLGAECGLCT